jgi:hypothetical protein
MLSKLAILLVFSILVTAGLGYLFQKTYPFVLASEKTRLSVEVTEEQSLELRAAAQSSDMITFSIVSTVLCVGCAAVFGRSESFNDRLVGMLFGAGLGASTGALAGWIGYWFQYNPAIVIQDPMVYSFARWVAMLVPTGLAAGLSTAIAGRIRLDTANAIIGSLLGVVAAAAVYASTSGSFTTVESRHKIFPHHMENRFLIIASIVVCIGAGIVTQVYRKEKSKPSDRPAQS